MRARTPQECVVRTGGQRAWRAQLRALDRATERRAARLHPGTGPSACTQHVASTRVSSAHETTRRSQPRTVPASLARCAATARWPAPPWRAALPGSPRQRPGDEGRPGRQQHVRRLTARTRVAPAGGEARRHHPEGVTRRYSRLSVVWARRDRLGGVTRLADLTEQLGVRYDEIYRSVRHLGFTSEQHPTSKELTLSGEEAEALRTEHARVSALQERSMKLPAAARQLK